MTVCVFTKLLLHRHSSYANKSQVSPFTYYWVKPKTRLQASGFFHHTGKSFSGALILASTNPKYDKRLFIELPVQYTKTTSSEHVVYIHCFECQNKNKKNNLCAQHVLSLEFSCNSMNNLLSYCGLVDARISAPDKDLPVS